VLNDFLEVNDLHLEGMWPAQKNFSNISFPPQLFNHGDDYFVADSIWNDNLLRGIQRSDAWKYRNGN
jgi:hypothetical protein